MIHRAELQLERSRRRNSRKGSHAVKSIHLIKIHKNAQITSKKSDRIEKRKKSRGAWKIITIRKDLLCITTCVCTSIYLFFVRALALLLLTAMSIIVLGDFFSSFIFSLKIVLVLAAQARRSETKSSTCVYSIISFTSSLLKSFFGELHNSRALSTYECSRDTQSAKEWFSVVIIAGWI